MYVINVVITTPSRLNSTLQRGRYLATLALIIPAIL